MLVSVFPTSQYSLYLTEEPFEQEDYLPTVSTTCYVAYGQDEEVTYYIAQNPPQPNVEGVTLEKASVGARFEDDYTKVKVHADRIVFVTKD